MIRTIFRTVQSLAFILLAPALFAQQPAAASDDHQLVMQLLQRVNELEAEVRQLKGAPPSPAPPVAAALAPAQAPPSPSTTSAAGMNMPGMILPDVAGLQFRGFTDVGFTATNQKGSHTTFSTGAFNLFMTSRLSDHFSVLGELLFEFDPANGVHTDLERAEFHYTPNDYFNLTAGRFHTAIGYYNTAYHHASWLLPTVTRPFLFAFEDQGGILPTHNVGVSVTGAVPSGPLGLHYEAELGNGRASINSTAAANVQVQQDDNNRKSFNLAAFSRPAAIPGLQMGFSVYRDRLYPTGLPKISETIWDGYVSYHPSGFEFTTEALELRHELVGENTIFHIPGFYSLVSKDVGRGVKPYFSWEYLNVAKREPLYGASIGLRHGPSTGIRYDFTDFAAFKVEYYKLLRRAQPDVDGVRADLAFTF